ncbi:MAG: NAD(P)/FAD-dependent oxidoreductase [Sandaracinaceae bacterium]
MMERIVVVGGGQAGGQAVATLRREGFDGPLHLVAAEDHLPYERPPLSKEVLKGDKPPESCVIKSEEFYRKREVELHLGVAVTQIDGHRVALADGTGLPFDRLLLATGSELIRLDLPGADLPGVHYLRTWEDAVGIREELGEGSRLVVVGGGYIGLEVAAAGILGGAQVVVLEGSDEVMSRVVARPVGAMLRRFHAGRGVDVRTSTWVTAFEGDERVRAVRTRSGDRVEADVVVIGVGVRPSIALAERAGLTVADGIVVDAFGRTQDPAIFAAGDNAVAPCPSAGRAVRLESWQNAQFQAMAAARAMVGRTDKPHDMIPWFWSDQYELSIQMLGAPARWDELVVRGEPEVPRATVFYLEDDRVVAVNSLGTPKDIRPAKRLMEARTVVDRAALADAQVPLASLS